MIEKFYYNHDEVWQQRAAHANPVWGGFSHAVYASLLPLIAAHLRRPKAAEGALDRATILDVGCGAGAFGIVLEAAGYAYIGVDESSVAVALGHNHFPTLDLRQVDFVRGSVATLGTVAVITAVNVLHCLTEPQERLQFLTHLRAHADQDTTLILTTMCAPVLANYRASARPRCFADTLTIKAELARAGWTSVCTEIFQSATDTAKVSNWTGVLRLEPR